MSRAYTGLGQDNADVAAMTWRYDCFRLQQLHVEYRCATAELHLGANAFPSSQTPFSPFTVLPWDLFSNASNYLHKHRNFDEGNKLKS